MEAGTPFAETICGQTLNGNHGNMRQVALHKAVTFRLQGAMPAC